MKTIYTHAKRLITITLLLVVFMSQSGLTLSAQQLQPKGNKERIRMEVLKAAVNIEDNRQKVKSLVAESKSTTYEVRQQIGNLKDNLDSLTKEQLELLKKAIQEIKNYKVSNTRFLETMSDYNSKIKAARENKEFDTLLILYNEILTLQNNHKESLTNYISLLDQIIAITP